MSAHHPRRGIPHRHPTHPAIWATAVAIVLLAHAAANGYVPLPPQIQQLARTMLQQITGPTGTHLLS